MHNLNGELIINMYSCSKCGNRPIIINRKHSGQNLCRECFIQSIDEKVLKTIRQNKLIDKGDKVLMALSGGKDSVVALHILNDLQERNIIDLTAVTINEGISGYREEGIKIASQNAKILGVNHRIVSFQEYFGLTLDDMMKNQALESDNKRHACTYCGVFRRYLLNKKARELGATKLATAHNLDDEAQSILMNVLRGDYLRFKRLGVISGLLRNKKFVLKITYHFF